MPMTNDSTTTPIQSDIINLNMKSPKASTINLIRQFARVYSSIEMRNCKTMVLN